MKKCLAFIMATAMLLCLAACGNTPATNEGAGQIVDKQAQYEDFFTKENFKTAGDSLKVGSQYADIVVVEDHSQSKMLEIRVMENYLRIYQLKDGKQYVNMKMVGEDGAAEESWVEYKSEEDQNAIDSTEMDTSAAELDLDGITKISYVETKDGVDVIKVYEKNPEYDENKKITEYQIAFKYKDADCTMIVTAENDGEGGESTSYDTENVADDFEISNYTIDYENKQFINDMDENEKIPFEITSQKEIPVDEEISVEVFVDEEKQVVTAMQKMQDGELVKIEFFDVESCLEGVEIPETVEECDEEDLGMAIFALLFSAMDFEAE